MLPAGVLRFFAAHRTGAVDLPLVQTVRLRAGDICVIQLIDVFQNEQLLLDMALLLVLSVCIAARFVFAVDIRHPPFLVYRFILIWSGQRGSNPHPRLGKPVS